MTGTAHIIRGDARHLPLADDSVDLVVTSPPYFALRSYQDTCPACRDLERTGDDPREAFPDWQWHVQKFHHYDGQIGDEATPAEFVDALIEVTRECVRVLKPSGSLWVNLGDKYAQSAAQWGGSRRGHQGILAGTSADEASQFGIALAAGAPSMGSAKPKSLIGIPWRYAIRCIDELGLILRAEVIWAKPNGLPESVTDRVRRSHEYWFHFTLAPRYFSAVDEIREASTGDTRPPSGAGKWADGNSRPGNHNLGRLNALSNPLGKLPGSVWTIPTEPLIVPPELGVDHFAAYPTEFPRRIIQGWCPAGVCVDCGEGRRPVSRSEITADRGGRQFNPASGNVGMLGKERVYEITGYACACPDTTAPTTPGIVLDPFGGTGTTALVAKALGRTGISVDMSADYCRLATWRTNDPKQLAKAARREFKASADPIEGQMGLFEFDGEAS